MLNIDELAGLVNAWRTRHVDRDIRFETIDRVVRGEFDVFDDEEERSSAGSPNLIQVALEDTAEAASLMPTVRVTPANPIFETQRKLAAVQEQVGVSYMDANTFDLLIPRWVMDAGAYGMMVATVTPDEKQRVPLIERRDPRTCYPESGWRPGDAVKRCFFAKTLYVTQLPKAYQQKVIEMEPGLSADTPTLQNATITVIEWYDQDEYALCGLWGGVANLGGTTRAAVVTKPILFDRVAHKVKGVCPVVIEGRITLDGEVRGQYDQVVELLEAHIKLMGLILDYADQAVYSDVWVRDLIGEMPFGGGSYIELGPNGAIGRVPPAVSSLNVAADLAALVDAIHVGGRWPKSRPGEIDQSIASAKFLEASAGMMNTAIRTYHLLLSRFIERTLRIAFAIDKAHFPGRKAASGILRNQQYVAEYDTKDILDDAKIRVEYGLGLGRDPAQSAVLHVQYLKEGIVSKEYVRENVDGLTDAAREDIRQDLDQFKNMALAKLLEGLQTKTIPDEVLIKMAQARRKGEDLFELYDEFIVQPQKEQSQTLPMQPGLPPGLPTGAPVGALPAPAAPGGAEVLARLNVPTADGGLLGSQVKGP